MNYTININNNITDNNTKTCSKCKKTLPLAQYSKCSASKDGLNNQCRACNHKANARYRANNEDKVERVLQRRLSALKKRHKQTGKGKFDLDILELMMIYFAQCDTDGNLRSAYTGKIIKDIKNAEIEHIKPIKKGGNTVMGNVVFVDKSENADKDTDNFSVYARKAKINPMIQRKIQKYKKVSYENKINYLMQITQLCEFGTIFWG